MGNIISPHGGTAAICHVKGQERHKYGHWFTMYLSKDPERVLLGKSCDDSQIHQRYPAYSTHNKF